MCKLQPSVATGLALVLASPFSGCLGGCGVKVEPLMPTPVLYTESGLRPLDHIPDEERWTLRRVYYATNRERRRDPQEISYGNNQSDEVSVGMTLIGFGGPNMTWADLNDASSRPDRAEVVELSVAGVLEVARFPSGATPAEAAQANQLGWLIDNVNDSIADARDSDVLIYVHGAKVNFYNACAFAAQLDHFMGRDMTSVAFAWPTRQNVFAYAAGGDVRRAHDSADALASLIELLAAETGARRIHVLSWSAGARLMTRTFLVLRERHPDDSDAALRERLRIGTAYFAAGDIPTNTFVEALPTINALVDRVIVTATSHDSALKTSSAIMGGGGRIGQIAQDLTDDQMELVRAQDRLEIIDVSTGSQERGFDITGHRYWFDHPWSSSDVLLAIRTDLTPGERGLVPGDAELTWTMPPDYPQRLARSLQNAELRSPPDP